MVAQNGIYIKNINTDDYESFWDRNNYLLTQPLGSRVYKVDYDSLKLLPYIEFPTDIANLIGDGLQIQYIATSGIQGNVSAGTLTKILSPSTFTPIGDDIERSVDNFTLFNASSITNGKDPETIDEMYQSFRRIVGTFDTLVTCKDYENEIYSLTDDNDNPLVSNVYVTDRRIDYNKSAQIISWDIDTNYKRFKTISTQRCALHFNTTPKTSAEIDDMNEHGGAGIGEMYYCSSDNSLYVNMSTNASITNLVPQEYINLNDFAVLTQAMTPYDLVLYAFKVFSMSDYNSNYYWVAYDNSFTPVSTAIRDEIKTDIEEVKCISHTWNDPTSDEVYCFKNYAPLNVVITPYNKVTEVEKDEIIDNIRKAISEKFNPRNIDFGVKLDIEDIEDVLVASDSRIRRVDILPIEYSTKIMTSSGDLRPVTGSLLIDLVAKNVLAGRICLFDFNEDFEYNYGQIKGNIYKNQSSVKTELYISLKTAEDEGVTNELQSTTTTTALRFKSTGSNLKYSFIIDNEDGTKTTKSYSLTNQSGYVLRPNTLDTFIIYELENSKIIKTTTFTSSVDESIEIFNYLDNNSSLLTTNSKAALNAGDILVNKNVSVATVESGVINLDYTLNKNEAIQIVYPNYYSDTTYSVYVNYRYIGNSTDSIKANTDHTLKASEQIVLIYSKDGVQSTDILYPGDVVYTSFDLIPTDLSSTVGTKKDWTDKNSGESHVGEAFKSLGTNQTISKRKLMTTKLNSSGIWCYWIVTPDTEDNMTLFQGGSTTRILRGNEYFIYTNSSLNELIILGAGTKLERTDTDDTYWTIPANTLTIESISNDGVSTSIPWVKNISFNTTPFYITEMNVITLGESDSIKIIGWSSEYMPRIMDGTEISEYAFNINGYDSETSSNVEDGFSMCDGSIIYTVNGTSTTLPSLTNFYNIKSRLDLNAGSGIEQELVTTRTDNSEGSIISSQRVTLNDGENDVELSSDNYTVYIQASKAAVALGNVITLLDETDFFAYSKDGNKYSRTVKITEEGTNSAEFPFFYSDFNEAAKVMIPVHMTGSEVPITAEFTATDSDDNTAPSPLIMDFNSGEAASATITLNGNNSYYLVPVAVAGLVTYRNLTVKLRLTWANVAQSENESLLIDDITVINGINDDLENIVDLDSVLSRMNAIIAGSDKPSTKPYYPYRLDNSIAMNYKFSKEVADGSWVYNSDCVWDKNNIVNKFTIAQIDLVNSVMDIDNDMKKGTY